MEAYCSTLESHKQRYLEKYGGVSDSMDPDRPMTVMAGLLTLGQALGDVTVMFEDLAGVAPSEIQTDVEAVRDALNRQQEIVSSTGTGLLGGLVSSFASSMASAGSWQRVGRWTERNCG